VDVRDRDGAEPAPERLLVRDAERRLHVIGVLVRRQVRRRRAAARRRRHAGRRALEDGVDQAVLRVLVLHAGVDRERAARREIGAETERSGQRVLLDDAADRHFDLVAGAGRVRAGVERQVPRERVASRCRGVERRGAIDARTRQVRRQPHRNEDDVLELDRQHRFRFGAAEQIIFINRRNAVAILIDRSARLRVRDRGSENGREDDRRLHRRAARAPSVPIANSSSPRGDSRSITRGLAYRGLRIRAPTPASHSDSALASIG
jgi:hypothetical protein